MKDKDYIIEKLTQLLIKQAMEEREHGKKIYVRKIECYKDLIKFFKSIDN